MTSRIVTVGLYTIGSLWGLLGIALMAPIGYKVLTIGSNPSAVLRAESGFWVISFTVAELLVCALSFFMMYAFFTFRRWGWWIAVVASSLLVIFFVFNFTVSLMNTGVFFVYGGWVIIWFFQADAVPAFVLGFCLLPSVCETMKR